MTVKVLNKYIDLQISIIPEILSELDPKYSDYSYDKNKDFFNDFLSQIWLKTDPITQKSPHKLYEEYFGKKNKITCAESEIKKIGQKRLLEIEIKFLEKECKSGISKIVDYEKISFCESIEKCDYKELKQDSLPICNKFPNKTDTDSFLMMYIVEEMKGIVKNKWYMSEKEEKDVGWKAAIENYIRTGYAENFHQQYIKQIKEDIKSRLIIGKERKRLVVNIEYTLKDCETLQKAKLHTSYVDFCECQDECEYKKYEYCIRADKKIEDIYESMKQTVINLINQTNFLEKYGVQK